ncbi:helix-turn-helix domain-containing protein [Streptomyces sp. NPDC102351]|uniref:helix-turn-helix domain-containing protein n=1 Tax=Streptomyces sp. NPDC102351 TaxID=3366158 RepID=UPI00382E8578
MYDISTRRRALALVDQGRSLSSVSRETGISRSALRAWRNRPDATPTPESHHLGPPACERAYAYLLGLYLGDGCISAHPRGGHYLRIACADAWPGLIDECREAITRVRPGAKVSLVPKQGCRMVTSYSRHWPALFPQHGPGKKHLRDIVLEGWQQTIVDAHPWEFIRGLIHSDGCRTVNWATRVVAGERRCHTYPRYFFTNLSANITGLFTSALDRVGVEWAWAGTRNISIARKASVALMDLHVGPKY